MTTTTTPKAPKAPKASFLAEVAQDLRLFIADEGAFMSGWNSVDEEVLEFVEEANEARRERNKAALLARIAKRK